MPRRSAGILPFRRTPGGVEVLLVHPGGPFWQKRDAGAWSIAKGEYSEDEQPEAAALREFAEETGWTVSGELIPLDEIRQSGGKIVTAFALEADFDPSTLASNTFEMEWPPRSGRMSSFPEVDRAAWFSLDEAHEKLVTGQRSLLQRLEQFLLSH